MANQKQSDRFYSGGVSSVAVPNIVGKAQEEFSAGDVSMVSGGIIVETLTVEESGFYNIYASTVFTNNPGGTGVDRAVQLNIHVNGVQQDGNGGYSQVNNTDTGIDYAGTSLAVQKALTAGDVVTIRVSSNTSTGAIKNAWRRLAITPIQQSGNNLLVGTTASATTTEEGMVKLNKFQTKSNTSGSSIIAPGEIPSLQFNNLEIGKTYRAAFWAFGGKDTSATSNDSNIRVDIVHDGVVVGYCQSLFQHTVNTRNGFTMKAHAIFTATGTTVKYDVSTMTGADDYLSNVTIQSQLEELNNYESETTDFT